VDVVPWHEGLGYPDMAPQASNAGAENGASEFEMRRAEIVGQIGDVSTLCRCAPDSKVGRVTPSIYEVTTPATQKLTYTVVRASVDTNQRAE